MIKFKNVGEERVDFSVPSTQTATNDKKTFLVQYPCQLKALYAKLGTAGVTGNQINDIHKNGTTIFTGATKLTFATTAVAATYDTFAVDPVQFVKGDVITLDVDSIHSGTAAENLNVILILQRLRGTGPVGATITDGIGLDAE